MTGTIINVVAVVAGGTLGSLMGARLSERMRETIMNGLGLLVIAIGIHLSLKTNNVIIVLVSLVLGGITGEILHIEKGINGLGRWLEQKTARTKPTATDSSADATRFSRAFLTASLVFCVGPMAILGSFEDGLSGDYSLLATKSALDFIAALSFASTMGPGVIFAALSVLAYQGTLTLGAGCASSLLTEPMRAEMSATGGVLMLALGLGLLELKQIRTGNLLPALAVAPVIVAILGWLGG